MNEMNKIVALLLAILFALSATGCATTGDRDQWYIDQHPGYKLPAPGSYEMP